MLSDTDQGISGSVLPSPAIPSILIVDDLISLHEMLEAVIEPMGAAMTFATNGEKALALYKLKKYDLVLADVNMAPMDGIELLKQLKAYDPAAVVIIMTAYTSVDSALKSLKYGAFDFLQKPFRVDELLSAVNRGLKSRATVQEVKSLPCAIEDKLVGNSPKTVKMVSQIKKLSVSRAPLLIIGESGTGKATIAEILKSGKFHQYDCSSHSAQEISDGLIGNGCGSWVKQANGGTLFLENIDALSLDVQKKLTNVIRNNNFKFICSSKRDLEPLVDTGEFYEELFYRLASMQILTRPLRDRTEEIPSLVEFFKKRCTNAMHDVRDIQFSDAALALLAKYRWPNNLTELGQVVTKLVSEAEARCITPTQLPLRIRDAKCWPTLAEHLKVPTSNYTNQVLNACGGDKVKAAGILGVAV